MATLLHSQRCTTSFDPFERRFGVALPRGLGAEAEGLEWPEFVARYSPTGGAVTLADWTAEQHAGGTFAYCAVLEVEGSPHSLRAKGSGPIAALTAMLHEVGRPVEILSFHQRPVAGGTVTFMHCEHDGRRHWAVAFADSMTESALQALVAAANILFVSNSATREICRKPDTPVCGVR